MDQYDQSQMPNEPFVPEPQNMPAPDNGKIFDSTQFTGVQENEESKPKKPSIFTKWQTWAIACGVVAIGATVAIVAVINAINDNNAILLSRYDAASSEISQAIESMENAFDKVTRKAYGVGENAVINSETIYPEASELKMSKNSCLSHFGVTTTDIDYLKNRKTGQELLDSGANLQSEIDRITELSASYHSATDAIESCSEDVLRVVADRFEIVFGELSITQDAEISSYVDFSQPVTVSYKGDRDILSVNLVFGLYDKNGIKSKLDRTIFEKNFDSGMTVEKDLYNNAYMYRTSRSNSESESRLRPKLIEIRGLYKK